MTREKRRAESEADAQERKEGRKLIADAMRMILQDSTATKAEIIFAACVLDSLLYLHAIPYRLSIPGSTEANIDDFAKAVNERMSGAK